MHHTLRLRLRRAVDEAHQVVRARWVKWGLPIIGLLSFYDLAGAQIIPTFISSRFPKFHEAVAAMTGWLPWWAWGWIATVMLAVAALEHAVRLRAIVAPQGEAFRTVAVLSMRLRNYAYVLSERSEKIANVKVLKEQPARVQVQFTERMPRALKVSGPARLISATRHTALLEVDNWGEEMDVLFEVVDY